MLPLVCCLVGWFGLTLLLVLVGLVLLLLCAVLIVVVYNFFCLGVSVMLLFVDD